MQEPLSAPRFEGFTLELSPLARSESEPSAGEPGALARRAWEEVAGEEGIGWTMATVAGSGLREVDLMPPPGEEVSARRAWNLCYALREHPLVAYAEPSFDVFLDGLADLAEPPSALAALSPDPEDGEEEDSAVEAFASSGSGEPPGEDEEDRAWSPKLVAAPRAWEIPPPTAAGRARGEGVVVAHPDSGYRRHRELTAPPSRLLHELERDFVDDDLGAEDDGGGHGLGTASVLLSLDNPDPADDVVTGVAPAALLLPLRVARQRSFPPTPVLLAGGTRRLRDAIYYALSEQVEECHVISISLGWLKNRSLHEAVKEAARRDVIVCAAAGNWVPFVVWPAHFPETIAVAGCTADRRKWRGSSRGKRVDVTAPGNNVWKAAVTDGGEQAVVTSSGTSFSAATVAGLAALWLAHHGREALLARYRGEFTLTTVFRHLLTATCDPPPKRHRGKFGAGIVNAERLLRAPLPTVEELRASSQPILESFLADPAPAGGGVETVARIFDDLPRGMVRARLADILGLDETFLDARLRGMGDEVAFHILTHPRLRELVCWGWTARDPAAAPGEAVSLEAFVAERDPRAELELSDRLAERLRRP